MIRWLLPCSHQLDELIALDAALRRGDLLLVGEQLKKVRSDGLPNGVWMLRQAINDYLASRHTLVLDKIESILDLAPPPCSNILALSHFLCALAHIDLKQPEETASALAAIESLQIDWPRLHRYCMLAQSTLALYLSRYEEAVMQLDELLSLPAADEDTWGTLQVLRIKGIIAHQQTNYIEALDLLISARDGYAELGDQYEAARCDKALANTLRRLVRRTKAEMHAESAVAYFREQALTIPLARCLNTLGSIELDFNQHDRALRSFETAAASFRSVDLPLELAVAIHNIGLTYRQLGHLRPAIQAYSQARAVVSDPYIPDIDARIAYSQAELLWHQGRKEEAIAHLQHATKIFQMLGAITDVADSWRHLATYLIELEQEDEAERLLQKSITAFLQHQQPAESALTGVYLGRLYLQVGKDEQAIPLLQTCADILEQHQQQHHAAMAYLWLGLAHLETDAVAQAESCFELALTIAPVERVESAWRASYELAQLAIARGEMCTASAHLHTAVQHLNRLRRGEISSQAAARLAREGHKVYVDAIEVAIKTHQPQTALSLLENQKALQLTTQLHSHHPESDGVFPLLETGPQIHEQNNDHFDRLQTAIHIARQDNDWARLSALEIEFQTLAESIAANNAPYASLFQPPLLDVPELRRKLDERHGAGKWACLTFGWLGEEPMMLTRFWLDSADLYESSAPLNAIQRQLVRLACHPEPSYRRKMLHWGPPSAQADALHPPDEWLRVERLLFPESIRDRLAGIQNLYIIPSGPLATFPFAAVQNADVPLGLSTNLSQVPSLTMLQALLHKISAQMDKDDLNKTCSLHMPPLQECRGLVCAVSQFPNTHEKHSLQATSQEAASLLSRLSPNSLLLFDDKRMSRIFKRLRHRGALSNFALIHFATHARLHPYHAQLSHIVLNEGVLYVPDILQWRLDACLVVLAACDTAVGHILPGDEQMGLPHAFLVAGAQRIIASLWSVPDTETASFFHEFYQALAPGDCAPAKGLRQARLNTHTMHPSPDNWAAFAHIGVI